MWYLIWNLKFQIEMSFFQVDSEITRKIWMNVFTVFVNIELINYFAYSEALLEYFQTSLMELISVFF